MKQRQLKVTKWLATVFMAVMFVLMAPGIGDAKAADSDGQWILDGNGWWYQYADGTYPQDSFVRIDGKRYSFNEYGYMETGWIKDVWFDGYVSWYYADETGAFVNGWRQLNGVWYYFGLTGQMMRNTYVDGKRYYVNDDGAWVDKSQAGVWMHDGIGWWYRWNDGSWSKDGIHLVDGDYYCFDENGYMVTGWCKPLNDDWFYFDGNGSSAKGWRQLDGIWYYFDEDGYMFYDTWIGSYYLDGNGAWQPAAGKTDGQWIHNGIGWWYQYADGTYPANGMYRINGTVYYFNGSGYMVTGWINNRTDTNPEWHYFNADGAAVYGWQQINGTWYYFYRDGSMASSRYIGSYYLDDSGAWTAPPEYAR